MAKAPMSPTAQYIIDFLPREYGSAFMAKLRKGGEGIDDEGFASAINLKEIAQVEKKKRHNGEPPSNLEKVAQYGYKFQKGLEEGRKIQNPKEVLESVSREGIHYARGFRNKKFQELNSEGVIKRFFAKIGIRDKEDDPKYLGIVAQREISLRNNLDGVISDITHSTGKPLLEQEHLENYVTEAEKYKNSTNSYSIER